MMDNDLSEPITLIPEKQLHEFAVKYGDGSYCSICTNKPEQGGCWKCDFVKIRIPEEEQK